MVTLTKRYGLVVAVFGLLAVATGQTNAGTVLVSSFANSPTPGTWYKSDIRGDGAASVVGNAPSGGSLPPGAALLTTGTTGSNVDMAEVSVGNNYGTAASVIPTISLSYDFYKATSPGANAAAAPSIKLTFQNANPATQGDPDQDVTLVYEPYWQPVHGGTVTTDTWFNSGTIDGSHGLFWTTAGFGQPNGAGGPPLHTLNDWLTTFNSDFQGATLTNVRVGIGSYTPNQVGYFDNVQINGTSVTNTTYNFDVAPVPEPATLVSAGFACLVGVGYGLRRRKTATKSKV